MGRATKPPYETPEGAIVEQGDILILQCNRPMSWIEFAHLRAKIDLQQVSLGKPIIIIPHGADVVKS